MLKYPTKQSRHYLRKRTGLKHRFNPLRQVIKRISPRELVTPDSSPPLNLPLPQSSESHPFPLTILPRPDIPVGGRLAHCVEQWEEFTDNKWVLSIVQNGFRIPFLLFRLFRSKMSQSSSPLLREEIEVLFKKQAVERVQDPRTPGFNSRIFLVQKKKKKKKRKVTANYRSIFTEPKSVRKSMANNDWAVSIDLTDAYLHISIHPRSRKYVRFTYEDKYFSSRPSECP